MEVLTGETKEFVNGAVEGFAANGVSNGINGFRLALVEGQEFLSPLSGVGRKSGRGALTRAVLIGVGCLEKWSRLLGPYVDQILPQASRDPNIGNIAQEVREILEAERCFLEGITTLCKTGRPRGFLQELLFAESSGLSLDIEGIMKMARNREPQLREMVGEDWMHDIRTPIALSYGYLQLLTRRPDREEYPQFRSIIMRGISVIPRVIHEKIEKLPDALKEPEDAGCNVLEVIRAFEGTDREISRRYGLGSQWHCSIDIDPTLVLEPTSYGVSPFKIEQVLSVIADNTAKQVGLGGEESPSEFRVSVKRNSDGTLQIDCVDNGSGYPAELIKVGFIEAERRRRAGGEIITGYTNPLVPTKGSRLAALCRDGRSRKGGSKYEIIPAKRLDTTRGARTIIRIQPMPNQV